MDYCIEYLRKSRNDIESETNLGIDVLKRHREILNDYAKRNNINVTKYFEEVVSGESISARPEIQKVLKEIENPLCKGVLVIEVERLARGDTIDQGIISRTFQYTNTKIITPTKTYDPNDEFDSEYFEFGLFMSRREYKTINRRLIRGRVKSVNEGKYIGSKCPFGYDKEKLPDKGFKLVPNKDAEIVKLIFNLLIHENMGTSKIANKLNGMNIKSQTNSTWTPSMVRNILLNKVYCGYLTWGRRKTDKKIESMNIKKSRPISKEYITAKGLHSPIISESDFELAQKLLYNNRSRTYKKGYTIQNPLSGLIKCKKCNHNMVRRPYKNKQPDSLICQTASCNNVSSMLFLVENKVLEILREKLNEYKNYLDNYETEIINISKTNSQSISIIDQEIIKIKKQLDKAFELIELGVYDIPTYNTRKKILDDTLEKLCEEKEEIEKNDGLKQLNKIKKSIPIIKNCLLKYKEMTIEEKNKILKTIIDHVYYSKDKGGRGFEEEFYLEITLKL